MTAIILLVCLGIFIFVGRVVYKQARKQFRLRNLQLRDLEAREAERKHNPSI